MMKWSQTCANPLSNRQNGCFSWGVLSAIRLITHANSGCTPSTSPCAQRVRDQGAYSTAAAGLRTTLVLVFEAMFEANFQLAAATLTGIPRTRVSGHTLPHPKDLATWTFTSCSELASCRISATFLNPTILMMFFKCSFNSSFHKINQQEHYGMSYQKTHIFIHAEVMLIVSSICFNFQHINKNHQKRKVLMVFINDNCNYVFL